MTPLGDYRSEMNAPSLIDDRTAELLLTGGAVDGEFAALVPVVQAYRDLARQPVAPRGELAARMVTGAFGSHAGPDRAAVNHNGHGSLVVATAKWRRVRMALTTGLATAAAKIAGLSVAAKASAGIAVAAASIGTAGAVGALPDSVQDRFDTVVETVVSNETPASQNENSEFGQRVSEDAKDGGVDGQEIAEEARQQGELRRPDGVPAPGEGGMPTELPTPGDLPTSGGSEGGSGSAPVDPPAPTPPASRP